MKQTMTYLFSADLLAIIASPASYWTTDRMNPVDAYSVGPVSANPMVLIATQGSGPTIVLCTCGSNDGILQGVDWISSASIMANIGMKSTGILSRLEPLLD